MKPKGRLSGVAFAWLLPYVGGLATAGIAAFFFFTAWSGMPSLDPKWLIEGTDVGAGIKIDGKEFEHSR